MHKLVYLTLSFSVQAQQINNINVSGVSNDGFAVSWDDLADWSDSYQVSVIEFGGNALQQQVTVSENSTSFTGLDAGRAFTVNIAAYNSSAQAILSGSQNQIVARTEGERFYTTQTWANGANGVFLWPTNSECSFSFNIEFPCAVDILMVSAGQEDYSMVNVDNTTFTFYLSQRSMVNGYIQWFAMGSQCDFNAITENDFSYTSFDGYSAATLEIEGDQISEWVNGDKNVRQQRVAVDSIYRQHCTPRIQVNVPCEAEYENSWSITALEAFEFANGETNGRYQMNSIWKPEFGFAYKFDEATCGNHTATFTIEYVDAPGLT